MYIYYHYEERIENQLGQNKEYLQWKNVAELDLNPHTLGRWFESSRAHFFDFF